MVARHGGQRPRWQGRGHGCPQGFFLSHGAVQTWDCASLLPLSEQHFRMHLCRWHDNCVQQMRSHRYNSASLHGTSFFPPFRHAHVASNICSQGAHSPGWQICGQRWRPHESHFLQVRPQDGTGSMQLVRSPSASGDAPQQHVFIRAGERGQTGQLPAWHIRVQR